MADTTTANIGLLIADLNDTFSFGAHVENNFTTIDGLMGAVQCTSGTRPTNTYAGQIIYETDSKRYVQNTGTKAAPVWTYMSHAAFAATSGTRPTVGRSTGQLLYETDTTRLLAWNGSAWEQKAFGTFVCTSSTHPASPFQGLEIYETDTGLSAVYTGSAYAYNLSQAAPTQTLSVAAASVTFSGLSSAVNQYLVTWRCRASDAVAAEPLWLRLNADSAAHYLWENLQGNNTTTSSSTSGAAVSQIQISTIPGASATANYFGSGDAIISGANDTTNFKTVTGKGSAFVTTTNTWCGTYAGQWNSASAVTSVTLLPGNVANFAAGSEFSIYAMQ